MTDTMDLHTLDKNELKALFLNINAEYLKIIDAPIATYIDTPEFLSLRKQLHEIMGELDNRRNIEPPLIHKDSPHALDPDALFDNSIFLTDAE